MAWRVLLAVLALPWALTACNEGDTAAPAPAQPQPPALVQALEAIPLPPPPEPQPVADDTICQDAIDMVIRFEIISPAYYTKKLIRPIWPGGASGVTVGVGYDLGHQIPTVIQRDWQHHPQADVLPRAAGVTHGPAKQLTASLAHVATPFDLASQVFTESTVPRYWQMTRRAFPGIEHMPPCTKGSVFSVTQNRGSSMAGDRNREKRAIRDECIPQRNPVCVAEQIRAMNRLWVGTDIAGGMAARREAEAVMALRRTKGILQ